MKRENELISVQHEMQVSKIWQYSSVNNKNIAIPLMPRRERGKNCSLALAVFQAKQKE